jgi:hypothetical protein
MRYSPHFCEYEFTRSPTARRLGIDNTPAVSVRERYRWLCVFILEPIRAHFRKPIYITSGYRCPALNVAVGGYRLSAHMCMGDEAACDFQVEGVPLSKVFEFICTSDLEFDQVILELGKNKDSETDDCIHIQIRGFPRGRALLGSTHGQGEYTEVAP